MARKRGRQPKGKATTTVTTTKPQDPSIPPADGTCMFIDKLPREIRDLIYWYACDPTPRLVIGGKTWMRGIRNGVARLIWPPQKPLPKKLPSLRGINWRNTPMGLLLVNPQVSDETIQVLYKETEFHFQEHLPAFKFLDMVPQPRLLDVRKLVVQYNWSGGDQFGLPQIPNRVMEMWNRLVRDLPNVEILHFRLDIKGMRYRFLITPQFHYTYTATWQLSADRHESLVGRLFQFSRQFPNLKHSEAHILSDYTDDALHRIWNESYPYMVITQYASTREEEVMIEMRWVEWYKALHKSYQSSFKEWIDMKENPWKEYLDMLRRYYDWRDDPTQVTGLYPDGMKKRWYSVVADV